MAGEVTDLNLYIGSGTCIVVLLGALALQLLVRPYPYAFQNTLEALLICASVLVVVLGVVYTFILKSSFLIEAVLLAVLLGSLLAGFGYLVTKHWLGHAAPMQSEAHDIVMRNQAIPARPPPPPPPLLSRVSSRDTSRRSTPGRGKVSLTLPRVSSRNTSHDSSRRHDMASRGNFGGVATDSLPWEAGKQKVGSLQSIEL